VDSSDLMFRPVGELAALVRSGELSARELVDASLERIDALQPAINAFVDVDPEAARAAADEVAAGDERPFAGVPIAIKNNRAVRGWRLTVGAELTGDFRKRLLEVDPKLDSFTYGPESYDAAITTALAAEAAGDDSGEAIGAELIGITRDGEKCTEYQQCLDLLKDGGDIDYDGVSSPLEFNETGSPSAATIGIFEYQADNNFVNIDYVTGST